MNYVEQDIRALWWKQPFLSLMGYGKIETRTWDTPYRGLVLMCGSQKAYHPFDIYQISGTRQIARMSELIGKELTGNAMFIGRLANTWAMRKEDEDNCFVQYHGAWDEEVKVKKHGIYTGETKIVTKQLYCHQYEDVQRIKPFQMPGKQGWKTLDSEIKKLIQPI